MDCLGMFVKYWEPGNVKTRLAATLGDQVASELYRQFVSTLVRRFSRSADQRILCFTPEDRAEAFRLCAGADWIAKPQSRGNLGLRMANFFESCFHDGAQRVVLIGSDSPTLPIEHVESAFHALHDTDVVLGPADDGGYCLVGASRDVAGIFEEIDWSTPRVWRQTVARLEKLQLPYETQPRWYDVDELTDLERLRDDLMRTQEDNPASLDLLDAVNRALW